MANIEIQPTTLADLEYISRNLRSADRAEYLAATGLVPEDTLPDRLGPSAEYTAIVDGKPAAIFGCADCGDFGAPWLLGTDALSGTQVGLWMVRWGRMFFETWATRWPFLMNYTHADNKLHHRYIRMLGCQLSEEAVPHGCGLFKGFTYHV